MSTTIIRAPRRHRFVIIDQRAVEDTSLSWAARGMLGYLLSRPDDWKVLVNDLRKRGDLGRDGIYRLLRELRNTGYMRFVRKRDRQGRIRGGTYIVREIAASPHTGFPDTDQPNKAVPYTAYPKALPTTDVDLRRTTTTPTSTKGRSSSCENKNSVVEFAAWVPDELRRGALEKVARLSPVEVQIVIDEWAGDMAVDLIETSPLGYLKAMVKRYEEGDLIIQFADAVAEIRSRPPDDPGSIVEIENCAVDENED
ncbi:MAG: hypothetical protein U9Q19_10635 [Pseudomonadota bacterium]|nr:hypothetical protein [Pseudomonadota bacterium]